MSKFNFHKSLAVGKAGEARFMLSWPGLEQLNGKGADFRVIDTGQLLELKTDSYDMQKTANFFIERWSDVDKQKPGGPFQALTHGSSIWVYMYSKNGTAFVFDTQALVDALPDILKPLPPVLIENRSWTTVGYKVPREALKHLYTTKEIT